MKLYTRLEALVRVHKIPSVGVLGEVKPREVIKRELKESLDFIQRTSVQEDLEVTKDTVLQYVSKPVKLHTKFTML